MAVTLTVNPRHRQLGGIGFPNRGRDVVHEHSPKSPARWNGGTIADVDKLVFRIPAVALLASGVGLICVTPVAFAVPGMQVLYVLPLAFAVWVLRNRTTVTTTHLTTRSTFGKRTVAWDDVKAVKLGTSWLSAVLTDDQLVRLPAVRMMHLEALAAISGGRITAPTAKPAVVEDEAAETDEVAGPDDTTTAVTEAAPTATDDVASAEGADNTDTSPDRARAERP